MNIIYNIIDLLNNNNITGSEELDIFNGKYKLYTKKEKIKKVRTRFLNKLR